MLPIAYFLLVASINQNVSLDSGLVWHQGASRVGSMPLSSSWWPGVLLGGPEFVAASLQSVPIFTGPSLLGLCVRVSPLPLYSLLRTPVIGFRVQPKSRKIFSQDF